MNKEQLMELGLTEEQADKVLAKYVNMIPKHRFDEVNEEKKELKNQLDERDAQLKELKTKASGNDELTAKISELEKLNKTTKEEYESKMSALHKETAIEILLKDLKARILRLLKRCLT